MNDKTHYIIMDNFNKIDELKKECTKIGKRLYILAFEGDVNKWESPHTYFRGKKVIFKKFSDRKLESDRKVQAKMLVFDDRWIDPQLDWVFLYRNTKGLYFNKSNKKHYLTLGGLNTHFELKLK